MDDIHIPCIVCFHGDPPPDLSGISDPIRIPFTIHRYGDPQPPTAAHESNMLPPTMESLAGNPPVFRQVDRSPDLSLGAPHSPPNKVKEAPDPAVRVEWPDGYIPIDPFTKRPLVKPAFVDLRINVEIGRHMAAEKQEWPLSRELDFYRNFHEYGPMDYQRTGQSGHIPFAKQYTDFANYNYGLVGAAAGYSLGLLLWAAGTYNRLVHPESNQTVYGLPQSNATMIEMGYQDLIAHGSK